MWFFEDDVYFSNEETLLSLDSKYPSSDLLTNIDGYGKNHSGDKSSWHWSRIDINMEPPYYCCCICCVRMSSDLLSKIRSYATSNNTLFFIEAMFPTVCNSSGLQVSTPPEILTYWRRDWLDSEIVVGNIYHPVKDPEKHIYYRSLVRF